MTKASWWSTRVAASNMPAGLRIPLKLSVAASHHDWTARAVGTLSHIAIGSGTDPVTSPGSSGWHARGSHLAAGREIARTRVQQVGAHRDVRRLALSTGRRHQARHTAVGPRYVGHCAGRPCSAVQAGLLVDGQRGEHGCSGTSRRSEDNASSISWRTRRPRRPASRPSSDPVTTGCPTTIGAAVA